MMHAPRQRPSIDRYLPERYQRVAADYGSSPKTPVEWAKDHATSADKALRQLTDLVNIRLAGLFGDWVFGVLGRPLESANENHGEAVWHYAEALAAADEDVIRARDEAAEVRLALVHCAERLQERWRKSNRPLPDDLAEIVVIAAAKSGWDCLFPPGDERHVHDTDSGGNCRNPACSYNSDAAYNERDPF
jgi:hypothetical protein